MDISKFKKALREGEVKFTYIKKDGTKREARGTLNEKLTPPSIPSVRFNCFDIVWDKEDEDGNKCELRPTMTVDIDAEYINEIKNKYGEEDQEFTEALEEAIVDALSEKSGWLVESFSYLKHEPKKLAKGTIFYYDLDKNGFRSFNESQLVEFTV